MVKMLLYCRIARSWRHWSHTVSTLLLQEVPATLVRVLRFESKKYVTVYCTAGITVRSVIPANPAEGVMIVLSDA